VVKRFLKLAASNRRSYQHEYNGTHTRTHTHTHTHLDSQWPMSNFCSTLYKMRRYMPSCYSPWSRHRLRTMRSYHLMAGQKYVFYCYY